MRGAWQAQRDTEPRCDWHEGWAVDAELTRFQRWDQGWLDMAIATKVVCVHGVPFRLHAGAGKVGHDCGYTEARNALISLAEAAANVEVGRTVEIPDRGYASSADWQAAVAVHSERWDRAFLLAMDRLWAERSAR